MGACAFLTVLLRPRFPFSPAAISPVQCRDWESCVRGKLLASPALLDYPGECDVFSRALDLWRAVSPLRAPPCQQVLRLGEHAIRSHPVASRISAQLPRKSEEAQGFLQRFG